MPMNRPKDRYSIVMLLLMIVIASNHAEAQWKVMSTVPALHSSPGFGTLLFKDGVLWAGFRSLSLSQDSGRSWRPIRLPDSTIVIYDVAFADSDTGVVTAAYYPPAAMNKALYKTTDRGATWTKHVPGPIFRAGTPGQSTPVYTKVVY